MSKFLKTSAVTLSAVLSVAMVMPAAAQTTMSVDQIMQMIAQLQAQLQAAQGNSACPTFARNLTTGMSGTDVKGLQQFLNSKGFTVSASGAGSVGNESTYFGYKTKIALGKFQEANNISPASGYFGPITRGVIVAMCAGGNAGTGGTTTPPGGTGGTTTPPISGTGLTVGLAASNPAAGSLISSASSAAARVPVLTFTLTAGSQSGVTVNQIKFHKNGVLADSSVSGAYLVENGKVLTQFSSISGGVLDFNTLGLSIAAGQTRTFTLAIDPAVNLSAGNTVSFAITSASDISAVDAANAAVVPTGSFPVQGNIFTVTSVSNPSIATLSITKVAVGSSVNAGQTGVLVSQWTTSVSNSPVDLKGINFRVVGSAHVSDIKNVTLKLNGAAIGPVLPSVGADGTAYFDLSSAPARLSTGSGNLQVFADIAGSPSFTFQFELLNSYDVYAVDTQYNVPITVTIVNGSGTQITINQGQITVTSDTSTPSGVIAKGGSGQTLAKFDIYAAGEAVRVKFLTVKFTKTGGSFDWSTEANVNSDIKNLQLVDDAGNQIGSTISTVADGTSSGTCSGSFSTSTTCYFGTSSSNINYTVPANTTRVISVKADIQTTADFSTITVSLPGDGTNLQGVTSSQTASSGAASGNTLTLSSTPLAASLNSSVGTQTVAPSQQNVKIGSYTLAASSAEGVVLSNVTITMSASSTAFQNVYAKLNGTVFGLPTQKTTLSGTDVITFSGNATIAAGQSQTFDVYASALSTASGSYAALTSFTSCTGSGALTHSSVSCSGTPSGQTVTVASAASVTITQDASTPVAAQITMGSSGNKLATFLLKETTNVEPVGITSLQVLDTTSVVTSKNPFTALHLVCKSVNGSASGCSSYPTIDGTVAASGTDFKWTFSPSSGWVIPQYNNLVVDVTGDLGSSSDNSAADASVHTFSIPASASLISLTGSPNVTITPSFTNATGNAMTAVAGKLLLSASQIVSGNQAKVVQDVANLTFNAAQPGSAVLVNSITLKFQGSAVSGTFPVRLMLGGADYAGSSAQNCNATAASNCQVTFTFTTGVVNVSPSSPVTVKVNVDATGFIGAVSNGQTSGVAQITVPTTTSTNWNDSVATTTYQGLEASVVPLNVATVSYQ